ncbi:MAG: hypothetical protein JW884_07625, partial [Deltaproteobacteria bacterium]|nr:hypothetical protein [Deltaproteobacteria bacterium]
MKERFIGNGPFRALGIILIIAAGLFLLIASGGGGGGGSSSQDGATSISMEEDVRNKIDLLMEASPCNFGFDSDQIDAVMDMVSCLFNLILQYQQGGLACPTVVITPDSIDLKDPPENITISVDFGQACAACDATFSGSATLAVTNITSTDTGFTAQAELTCNNLTIDSAALGGQTIINGAVTASLSLTVGAAQQLSLTGAIAFNNFSVGGTNLTGSITISLPNLTFSANNSNIPFSIQFANLAAGGTTLANGSVTGSIAWTSTGGSTTYTGSLNFANLQTSAGTVSGSISASFTGLDELSDLTITFGNFVAGTLSANGTIVVTDGPAADETAIDINLTTSEGTIDMVMIVAYDEATERLVISSEGSGTAGLYSVNINDVTIDPSLCQCYYPVSGSIDFTGQGKQGVIEFSGDCTGTY